MSKRTRVPQKPKAYTPRTFEPEPDWKEPKIRLSIGKKRIKHKLSIYDELI